jgi:hypothetical protein
MILFYVLIASKDALHEIDKSAVCDEQAIALDRTHHVEAN